MPDRRKGENSGLPNDEIIYDRISKDMHVDRSSNVASASGAVSYGVVLATVWIALYCMWDVRANVCTRARANNANSWKCPARI